MRKAVPVRFPANNDSVGIELVGECVLDPNLIKPGMNAQQIDALRARHRVGKITNITIAVASKSNNYDPTENCASFALTPRSSEFFFHHAKVVSEASAAHDFDYSSCYAEGEVVFSNGDEGHWSIAHGGTGSLLLRSGKFKGQLIHLYCKACADRDI